MAMRLKMDMPRPDVFEVWLEVDCEAVPSGRTTWEPIKIVGTGQSEEEARQDASAKLRALEDGVWSVELPTP